MNKTIFALAAGIFAMSAPAVTAGERPVDRAGVETSHIELVQHRHHRRNWKHRHQRQMYRDFDWNDRRYRAYRGWNRYYDRPYRWRSRGCVAVGPIWFCP